MRDLRQFWSLRRIGEERVTLARLGSLRLWLARADREWGFAYEHGEVTDVLDISQVPEDVVPEGLEWRTTLFEEAPREFILKPAVPDRPLVVKPTYPVLIPERENGVFYAVLPVFVRVCVSSGKRETELGILPTRLLSDTWFGSVTEGEFCYSLPVTAERDISAMEIFPHHIVSRIEIQNRSNENLTFEKLCFRPHYMGLFCGDRHLWSSRVQIQHEGYFKGAHVKYRTDPPELEPNLLKLTEAKRREERGLSRLTFSHGFSRDIVFGK